MSLLSLLVYVPLQIVFFPISIIAVLWVAYKQIGVSKRLGISQTAIEIVNGRWTLHWFGLRKDEASARLARVLPNTSVTGLIVILFPLWLKKKISGKPFMYPRIAEVGHEGFMDMVMARSAHFDRIIERNLNDIEQFVVLGAGYDTRAYNKTLHEGVKFFEVDQPDVQDHKRKMLEKAGISSDHVTFVSVDFEVEDAFESLTMAGYDPSKKTLFLWEGVTLYLSRSDVHKTMQDVRKNSAAGSILLLDIYSNRFGDFAKKGAMKGTLELTDEMPEFFLPFETGFEEVLRDFVTGEEYSPVEANFIGSLTKDGPYMVVAELKV